MLLILISILFLFIGLIIGKFKYNCLVKGYNNLDKQYKENLDIRQLIKSVAMMCYLSAFINLTGGILGLLFDMPGIIFVIITSLLLTYCIWYIWSFIRKRKNNKKYEFINLILLVGMSIIIGISVCSIVI